MMSRTSLGILSAALAFAIAAPFHAAPAASAQAAPAGAVIYQIERHNQQVTVKDADGKMLVMCTATTPTIQGVLMKNATDGGVISADRTVPHHSTFTLEDQNGRRLWSTVVPVVSPNRLSFKYNPDVSGSQLIIAHQTEDTSNPDQTPISRLVMVLGPDGRPVSMSDGHKTYSIAISPTSVSLTDPTGKTIRSIEIKNTGAIVNLNGTKLEIKQVTKDGKVYTSFPWNGHYVLIEQSCNWNITSDGNLTVSAPSTAKTTASK